MDTWCNGLKKAALAAMAAAVLTLGTMPADAQKQRGGGRGSDVGRSDQMDRGGPGERASGRSGAGGSLRDVFRAMEDETRAGASTVSGTMRIEPGEKKGRSKTAGSGKKGSTAQTLDASTKGKRTASGKGKSGKGSTKVSEDSDRPAWAGIPGREGKPGRGSPTPGTKKGDLYGDMYVILRDANGLPILKQLADGTWVVQPIGADGQPLPLDAEGNLINPELALEVELGRLNVGRSPLTVLATRYEEAIKAINAADTVTLDASGRLVLTTAGVVKTIDAPLENLAIYVELLNKGTLTGVIDPTKFASISYLVDGTFTTADLTAAASFLAAASDKSGTLTIDKVVYMNSILGIVGTLTDSTGKGSYVDYSTFSYDRLAVYALVTVDVLVKQPDGSYKAETVNVYETLFNSVPYTSDSGVDGFAQAADDARAVIEYVHNNAIPETQ